ncbi:heat shock factor protein 3-like [Vanessa atalanta]|uniref:heat shock factor protein 3-like n=1 Tax=Vanessa atalanta TaxID=42275 RepID=UPI001FCCD081|nr:heat shock factor protein 3-like [Vanessa atalanta]
MQEATNAILQMRFPQKLWYLLNLHTDAILWGGTGRTILLNYRVLQHYLKCDHSIFKTTNISSFIRQLNLYGFRKVTSHLQDPLCNSSNPYMHEFIHDNFQYGRPELLNKITRKALTMKRGFKPKSLENSDQIIYISPLQKARRALRLALKKAAQDLLVLNSSKDCNSQYVDSTDDYCEEEENIEFDWLITDNVNMEHQKEFTKSDTVQSINENSSTTNYGDLSQDGLLDFSGNMDTCQPNNENFSTQFLSMPDLDEPTEKKSDVELLAEFNITSDIEEHVKSSEASHECNSLNCVLPSVNNQIDDGTMAEKDNDINHYHGEWDQMLYDIIDNKGSNQEGLSNFRELYSQISQTIDLLNS